MSKPIVLMCACMVKSLQSHPTLWGPKDCSLPGSSVHGILQARIVKWVAMSSFMGSSWLRDWTYVSYISCIGIFTTSITWEAPFNPGMFDSGIEPWSPTMQVDFLLSEPPGKLFCVHNAFQKLFLLKHSKWPIKIQRQKEIKEQKKKINII